MRNDNPGPGAYTPAEGATLIHAPGANPAANIVSKTGRDHHFASDNLDGGAEDAVTAAHVGPGSYEPLRTAGGESGTISHHVELEGHSLLSASVASDTTRPADASLW